MKKLKIKISALLIIFIFVINPIAANAEWLKNYKGWMYTTPENAYQLVIGWKNIDGRWYCFNSVGYMLHDEIIDGSYYLDSNGVYIESPSKEIREYMKIIKSNNWNNYRNTIIDLNNDGIKEMILNQSEIKVITYDAGNINILNSDISDQEYCGYNKTTNELLTYRYSYGEYFLYGYKLVNNKLEKTLFYLNTANDLSNAVEKGYYLSEQDYENHKSVSKDEYYTAVKELFKNLDNNGKNVIIKMFKNLEKYKYPNFEDYLVN